MPSEKLDVAVNIFAKPFQTSLALLSLLKHCDAHIAKIWLQFEPFGSRFDTIPPYFIATYLQDKLGANCNIFQPRFWLARQPPVRSRLEDVDYRQSIRYQKAFEESTAKKLFVMHNDVVILKDILGVLKREIGDAFVIGQLGQCWNCPANNEEITRKVMGRERCVPESYQTFKPDMEQLARLYEEARMNNVFVRSYDDGFRELFATQPWTLPECRVNEWACLINLEKTRPLTMPFGSAAPFGAFQQCGSLTLDTAVAWFRAMHSRGLHAKHFNLKSYVFHYVGTGNKSARNYSINEDRAKRELKRQFPEYLTWLEKASGKNIR